MALTNEEKLLIVSVDGLKSALQEFNSSKVDNKVSKSGDTLTGALITKNLGRTINTLASASGAITIDASNGDLHILTLSGAVSGISISNATSGLEIHVILYSSTLYTIAITHSATYICPEATDLSLTVKAGGYCEIGFLYDGSKFYVRGI